MATSKEVITVKGEEGSLRLCGASAYLRSSESSVLVLAWASGRQIGSRGFQATGQYDIDFAQHEAHAAFVEMK